MRNYIKFLVLSTMVLVVGNSNSYSSSIISKLIGKKHVSTTTTTVNNQARKQNEDICMEMRRKVFKKIDKINKQANLAFCGDKNTSKHTSSMLGLLEFVSEINCNNINAIYTYLKYVETICSEYYKYSTSKYTNKIKRWRT